MSSQTSGIDPVGVARPADLDGSVFEEKPQPMSDEGDHQPPAKATNTVTKTVTRPGDRIFSGLAKGSGVFVVALIGLVAVFLILRAVPALSNDDENFFLYNGPWRTDDTSHMQFGVLDLFQVTVFVSVFALLLAMPVALGIAIYLTEYAPARVRGPLAYVIDLLAAVPSIVYGLWGIYVLAPAIDRKSVV